MKARVAASIVLALSLSVGMAGCTLITPQATTHHYDASDGVGGSVGSIDVRNALIIADSQGKVGNLVVTFVNTSDKPHRVTVQHGSSNHYVTVPAFGVKKIGAKGTKRVLITNLGAKPGALTDVFFQYSDETGVQLSVPVLDGSQPEYADYKPGS